MKRIVYFLIGFFLIIISNRYVYAGCDVDYAGDGIDVGSWATCFINESQVGQIRSTEFVGSFTGHLDGKWSDYRGMQAAYSAAEAWSTTRYDGLIRCDGGITVNGVFWRIMKHVRSKNNNHEVRAFYSISNPYIETCPDLPDSDDDETPDEDDIDSKSTEKKGQGKKPKEKFPSCPQNFVTNPINIFNGNNLEQETDLTFNSPFEGGLTFRRFYNSQSTDDSTIGFGWTHNDNYILNPDFGDSSQLIEIIDATGRGIYFDDNDEDGTFKGAFSENSTITKDVDDNFIWTRDDGTVYKFEQITGKLLSITDRNGNIQFFTYNANNLLETITDQASGQTLTIYYNANNKIDHISGPATLAVPDGVWVSYVYDANNNLIRVQYADDGNGSTASGFDYRYEDPNDPNNLTSKRDLAGTLLSTWTYNASDQAISNTNTQGTGASLNYTNPNEVEVTNAYGITTIYSIEEIAGRKKITMRSNANGCNTCSDGIYQTDFDTVTGNPTRREYFNGRIDLFQNYDNNDNPQTIVIAQGTTDEKTITKTHHPTLSIPLTITQKSLFADVSNPDRNKVTIYDYDNPSDATDTSTPNETPSSLIYRVIEQGFSLNLTGIVVPYERMTVMTYNLKGQLLSIDGPLLGSEDTILYAYHPDTGNLVSVTSPKIGTMTFEHDLAGNVIRLVDHNNIETLLTYDGRNRQVSATVDGKTTSKNITASGMLKNFTDMAGRTLEYSYNIQGQLDKITNPAGEYLSYAYDNNANLTEESIFSYQGTQTRYTGYDYGDPANNSDLSPGKPWKSIVKNQDNTADLETIYKYSHGNITQAADPAGGQTDFIYDTLNRVIQKTERLSDIENAITTYAYDSQNNLIGVTDANDNQTVYTYDDAKRLVKQVSSDTGTTLFAYDTAGHMLSKTLNDGRTTEYTYDILGRVTSILYDDNTQDTIYLYDQNINGIGKLTGMSDASGNYAFFYDAMGNMVRNEKTINQTLFTTAYAYDGAGNITSMTYPDGRIVTYDYNFSGNVNAITTDKNGVNQVLADAISYLPFGPVQTMAFGNDQIQLKTFDLQYRPNTLFIQGMLDLSYGYDPIGNITTIIDSLNAQKNLTFSYDKAGKLTRSIGPLGTIDFTYDRVGNRLTRSLDTQTQTYDYINGSNRLLSITGPQSPINLTYDDNGNMITKGDQTFEYSQNNRLISVSENNQSLGAYIYNSFGQRSQKIANDQTIVFHYDINNNLIAESDAQDNISKAYIYLGNQRIAVLETSQDQNFVVQVQADTGASLEGVKVYVFNENNSYAGIYATTNQDGQAIFEKSLFVADIYQFRADYLNDQFWSDSVPISSNSTMIQIDETHQAINIIQNNSPVQGITVYVFDENGSYLGLNSVTDATGTVWFDLPVGQGYTFRADIMGTQFFSDTITIGSEVQEIVIDSQGGILNFSLKKTDQTFIADIKTYLFSTSGTYLGQYKITDNNGHTSFEVPNGSYKIRCDYMGYQFWSLDILITSSAVASLEIPHNDVTFTVNKKYQTTTQVAQGIKAYLFTQSGTYLGIQKTTDVSGQAIFSLPQKAYKIRADYLNDQYFSNVSTWTNETITIAQGMATLSLTNLGLALPDVTVYAFDSSGAYLGLSDTTDAEGHVSFVLPQGSYQFRADWMNNQYLTGLTQITADETIPVPLSTCGGTLTLTIKKGANTILEGIKCYLFNSIGIYLGTVQTTDSSGQVSFNIGDGEYKIRADYMGYQFWTSPFTIPGELNQEFVIPHQQVTITVNQDNNSTLTPCDNVKAYLFTEAGVYQDINKTTDANGTVTFDIPQMPYKVRADFLSKQYWSDAFTGTDQTIVIEQGQAIVEVKQNTTLLENIKVYVFTDQDQYLGINGQTDVNGLISFDLPQGTYKFRADYLNSQYWATQFISAHNTTPVSIDTQGALFSLTLEKQAGQPMENFKIYAFSSTGSYLGLNQTTNETGLVSFDLPDGDYRFRADYLGYQFWTDTLSIPQINTSVLTIPHQDVEITINSQYETLEPLPGAKVYVFTESGVYQGMNATTDAMGKVIFNLPDQSYKVRADFLSKQYWSQPFTGTNTDITINHAKANLHISLAGANIANARVCLFSETGSYLGRFDNTDEQGNVTFLLPANTYKFRVDYNSTQYWSDPASLAGLQENNIDLNLDLLAANLTANPYYARYDGKAPEKERILLASNDPTIPYTDNTSNNHTVYYFINDHLGTPLKVMDSQGQIVWSSDYTPFGQANVNNNSVENGFRFPGQYYDGETGLHYNYHRYYDPDTGRYLTPDPIGLAGGINPFVYASLNPVNAIDPFGLLDIIFNRTQETITATEGTTTVKMKATSGGWDGFPALPTGSWTITENPSGNRDYFGLFLNDGNINDQFFDPNFAQGKWRDGIRFGFHGLCGADGSHGCVMTSYDDCSKQKEAQENWEKIQKMIRASSSGILQYQNNQNPRRRDDSVYHITNYGTFIVID